MASEDEAVAAFLRDMFPEMDDATLQKYVESGHTLDSIVTEIVEKRPSIRMSVTECLLNLNQSKLLQKRKCDAPKQLNFPEIFRNEFVDTKIDPIKLRNESRELYKQASVHRSKIRKGTAEYYTVEADCCIEKANRIKRHASLVILQRMLNENKTGTLDLHNLYVDEAVMFIADYLQVGPSSFVVITGNSQRIRPAIKKFLISKKYAVTEEGPFLRVEKKRY